jgi:hypothetical protein
MTGMTRMTCDECRQAIAVADLTDWGDMDGVAAHCRTCETCAVVVAEVRDSARRVAELLDGIPAGVPAALVARRAAAAAAIERQRRRRWRALAVPVAAGSVLLAFGALAVSRSGRAGREQHHIVLQCLTPEQAATLVAPILARDGRVAFSREAPLRVLTISGPARVVGEAQSLIAQLDNPGSLAPGGSCVVPQAPPDVEAAAMEDDMRRAHQEAERANQEVERARQEAERAREEAARAREEAEHARQEALSHRR